LNAGCKRLSDLFGGELKQNESPKSAASNQLDIGAAQRPRLPDASSSPFITDMSSTQTTVASDSMSIQLSSDPHALQPLLTAGPRPEQAEATVVLLHGRGASAESMLSLYGQLILPTIAALAPQAAGSTWYPHSFLAPIEANQPFLDSALNRIESLVGDLLAREVQSDRIALLGFSQGACLTAEFVARHPRRYAAVIAFTGALIGPPGTARNYAGSLHGTPVFLGTGDPDPHVPFEQVKETAAVLKRLGAEVELRRYPGMPHMINEDELAAARSYLLPMAAKEVQDNV
jgi:predicted esterase